MHYALAVALRKLFLLSFGVCDFLFSIENLCEFIFWQNLCDLCMQRYSHWAEITRQKLMCSPACTPWCLSLCTQEETMVGGRIIVSYAFHTYLPHILFRNLILSEGESGRAKKETESERGENKQRNKLSNMVVRLWKRLIFVSPFRIVYVN